MLGHCIYMPERFIMKIKIGLSVIEYRPPLLSLICKKKIDTKKWHSSSSRLAWAQASWHFHCRKHFCFVAGPEFVAKWTTMTRGEDSNGDVSDQIHQGRCWTNKILIIGWLIFYGINCDYSLIIVCQSLQVFGNA